jgi:hypothetical protein
LVFNTKLLKIRKDMKITPVSSPAEVQQAQTSNNSAARERAIAMLTAQAPVSDAVPKTESTAQKYPVSNPNQVSVEELSAIKTPAQPTEVRDNDAKEEVEAPAPKDPEAEKRFQQLARQERQLRAKIQQANIQFKQREADLKAREAALQQPTAPDLSKYIPRERLQTDPLSVLEEAQVSWDELSQQVVNRQPTDPRVMNTIQQLKAQIAELKQANEKSAVTYQEQQQQQYQAAVKQIKADVHQLVQTDPEFETVKAMNATKDVVELIEKTYAKDGVVLSVEEATKAVEDYLVEEAMKVTQLDKIKKRMAASNASKPKPEEKTQPIQQTQQMKTLTNATSGAKKISARERAIARANGFVGDF